ncbi:MAG TPA: hypothetical protein VMZ92_16200, partial [Planctomycetota bacterium]|nr:hypothetical protein [Planctomycetota bacterium]
MSGGAVAAGAAAAAIANAIKASGAIIHVEPEDFETILSRSEHPLVVSTGPRWYSKTWRYLTAYKGLIFYTKTPVAFEFGEGFEVITAQQIWIPG